MFPQKDDSLKSCPKCGQHYRVGEDSCPHCKASLDSSNSTPPGNQSALQKLGRVMYGPSRIDLDQEGEPDDRKSAMEDKQDEDRKKWTQKLSEDDSELRVMYGPPSYIPGKESASWHGITYFFWVAIVLLISLLVWFLLK
ncbi:MAG: hypothetical protein JNJ77_11640 [Planctomycetia bacterium]|nr:hypothetical protein [Planctomycetia bacterium]